MLGAIGVWRGYPIVGLRITIAILFTVMDSAASIWRRMMDSVDPEVVEGIGRAASGVEKVEGVESVRARWVGHRVHGEISVRVPRDLSVAEAACVKE